jgi:hypothetical protein
MDHRRVSNLFLYIILSLILGYGETVVVNIAVMFPAFVRMSKFTNTGFTAGAIVLPGSTKIHTDVMCMRQPMDQLS